MKTDTVPSAARAATAPLLPYPTFAGIPERAQVLRFSIPPEIAASYPELAQKQVGWGLTSHIVEELQESGRFRLVEAQEAMQARILEQWALSQSGLSAQGEVLESPGLEAPRWLVYAEITDFAISHTEQIQGLQVSQQAHTRIGVQIRVVDVRSGEFIPASGVADATAGAQSLWAKPEFPFDQSTVGCATRRALRTALLSLFPRMESRGAWAQPQPTE